MAIISFIKDSIKMSIDRIVFYVWLDRQDTDKTRSTKQTDGQTDGRTEN